jgi:hypothetical protein
MAMGKQARSLLTLVALVVVAGGLGAYAYYGVLKGEEAEQKQKELEAKAFDLEKASVKKLSLTAKGQTVRLERDGEEWRIVEPVQARAEKFSVEPILDKLADLKSKAVVADTRARAADFGLAQPQFTVVASYADKAGAEKTATLEVGDENPLDLTIYYAKAGDDRIFTAEPALKYPLDKSLYDLRDKSLVVHEDKDVQQVVVETNGGGWSAERDGDAWKLTAPVQDAGDKGAIEGVLSKLRTARVKAFAAETADQAALATYGLDKPAAVVTFALGADRATKILRMGEATVDGAKKTFARLGDAGPVMEVEASVVTDLAKPASELRDRSVAPFDREKARKVTVAPLDGEPLVFTRSKEKAEGATAETDKYVVDGVTDKLKEWKLSSALYTLSSLKGTSIVEDGAKDLGRYGLDKPNFRFSVEGDGAAKLAEVLVGAQAGNKYYAARAGSGRVYEVEKATIDDLPKRKDDVRDTPPPPAADAGP